MAMAGDIFTDMVLQEAIKDKTAQVEKEMMEAQKGNVREVEDVQQDEQEDSDFDDDMDDFMDEESEKIMRSLK